LYMVYLKIAYVNQCRIMRIYIYIYIYIYWQVKRSRTTICIFEIYTNGL